MAFFARSAADQKREKILLVLDRDDTLITVNKQKRKISTRNGATIGAIARIVLAQGGKVAICSHGGLDSSPAQELVMHVLNQKHPKPLTEKELIFIGRDHLARQREEYAKFCELIGATSLKCFEAHPFYGQQIAAYRREKGLSTDYPLGDYIDINKLNMTLFALYQASKSQFGQEKLSEKEVIEKITEHFGKIVFLDDHCLVCDLLTDPDYSPIMPLSECGVSVEPIVASYAGSGETPDLAMYEYSGLGKVVRPETHSLSFAETYFGKLLDAINYDRNLLVEDPSIEFSIQMIEQLRQSVDGKHQLFRAQQLGQKRPLKEADPDKTQTSDSDADDDAPQVKRVRTPGFG